MHTAVRAGDACAVQALLLTATVVNEPDEDHLTPLQSAAMDGHVEVVEALLADPRVHPAFTFLQGWTPLQVAVAYNHAPVVEVLLRDARCPANPAIHGNSSALGIAAANGYVDIVKMLLNVHGYHRYIEEHGETSMHYAASGGHIDVLQELFHAGADASVRASNGDTPMSLAAKHQHVSTVSFLVDKNVQVDQRSWELMKACRLFHQLAQMMQRWELNPIRLTWLHSLAL
jgi:ankyrin repeat protein